MDQYGYLASSTEQPRRGSHRQTQYSNGSRDSRNAQLGHGSPNFWSSPYDDGVAPHPNTLNLPLRNGEHHLGQQRAASPGLQYDQSLFGTSDYHSTVDDTSYAPPVDILRPWTPMEHMQDNANRNHSRPKSPDPYLLRNYPPTNPFAARAREQAAARKSIPRIVKCDDCGDLGEDRSYCNVCNENFCDQCWARERRHRKNHHTADGVPHEKTNHIVAKTIQSCLEAPKDADIPSRHADDEHTAWFGVTTDHGEDLIFEDFGRYAALLAEGSAHNQKTRYPGLISFVGQTGAGKSTLIKFLIELRNERHKFESPVVGSVNTPTPTSGDVHLYKDPHSALTSYPILFADCEGLQGGERVPLGAKSRHKDNSNTKRTSSFHKKIRKLHNTSKRDIQWANDATTRTREYAVANLYPRLLFTFSDVIVFVSKNPRVIENTIVTLLEWADTALETSSNQPVLPHLIIALNASENMVDEGQWDVDIATQIHTNIPFQALQANPRLNKYIKYWRERRKPIGSAMDLLKSYYKDVRVIRIPTGARPKVVHEQMQKLYTEIESASKASRDQKRQQRMLLNADELQPYLQSAFDHFSKTLNQPFDFVKASFQNNSIPNDFGGGILRMALNVMQLWKDEIDAEHIFTELSTVVASCIMLDCVRRDRLGGAETTFPHYYMALCDDALEDFCAQHWPCEFVSDHGRCVNVKNGHNSKGHQLSNGKVFAFGNYRSSFTVDSFLNKWRSLIFNKLHALFQEHSKLVTDFNQDKALAIAYQIHQDKIVTPFFRHVGSATKFINHSTCYLCLMAPPEHPLPCGHVFCSRCLQVTGRSQGKCAINVTSCPLRCSEDAHFDWTIKIVPETAGVRILTLDGGGIKGIGELAILRLLEREFKHLLKIQDFFDLIVGTSAGGIIALGLGVENWSINRCMSEFESFCHGAFTLRKGGGIPLVGKVVAAHYSSKYRTRTLETTLSDTFSDELLFGGQRMDDRINHSTKVAVIATTPAGVHPVVLSNYNRPANSDVTTSYHFQRPDSPECELKVWEAARATSAAPTFFKSFLHRRSHREYIDGGLKHNNPIAVVDMERKIIWPSQAHRYPDIVVSVGAGFSPTTDNHGPNPSKRGALSMLSNLYDLAVNTIRSGTDAEKTWNSWLTALGPDDNAYRFHRLNAHLVSSPPKMDDVQMISQYKQDVEDIMLRDTRFRKIAQQLIATCFFFERTSTWVRLNDGKLECSGRILCRFMPQSPQMKNFGLLLQSYVTNSHVPCFVVTEQYREVDAQQVLLTSDILSEMIRNGRFKMGVKIRVLSEISDSIITLCLEDIGDTASALSAAVSQGHVLGYPISGFPCYLNRDDNVRESPYVLPGSNTGTTRRRTSSRQMRATQNAQWNPQNMDPEVRQDTDPIGRFNKPWYHIGGATPEALESMSLRYQTVSVVLDGPAELSSMNEEAFRDPDGNVVYELD